MIYIYSLIDPRTNKIRYIGKTNNPIQRLKSHTFPSAMKGNTHRDNWIRQLKSLNLKLIMSIIEECNDTNWVEREKYWIAYYRNIYDDLTNGTNGGDGVWNTGLSDESKKKHLDSCRTEEMRAFRSKKVLGNNNPFTKLDKEELVHKHRLSRRIKNGYIGIYPTKNKWGSEIQKNGQTFHLGTFNTKLEAQLAYDEKSKELFKEKAVLNFPIN